MAEKVAASFVEPMLLLQKAALPAEAQWIYELKLDGYRSISFKRQGIVHLRSRNDKDFNRRYRVLAEALSGLPDETVIDGEIVALDESGRPSFNALQTFEPGKSRLLFYVFDVMILGGRDLMRQPLAVRRALLEEKVLPHLDDPIRYSAPLEAALPDIVESARNLGLEGLIAKRSDSRYEPGLRSGAWQKMRLHQGQEFVIGGYTIGNPFDALVFGYYEGGQLLYAARTRNGFTPSSRAALYKKFHGLEMAGCPFVNLPETTSGRWGQGLTKEKMKSCRWLKPALVGQFEFLEWTGENHLRHAKFVALREDKKAGEVVRERSL